MPDVRTLPDLRGIQTAQNDDWRPYLFDNLHLMTPEDVLIEAIAAASLHGDTPELRVIMCSKLHDAIHKDRSAAANYAISQAKESERA